MDDLPYGKKRCATCKRVFDSDARHFYRCAVTTDGLRGDCKSCHKAKSWAHQSGRPFVPEVHDETWVFVVGVMPDPGQKMKVHRKGPVFRWDKGHTRQGKRYFYTVAWDPASKVYWEANQAFEAAEQRELVEAQ